MFNGQCSTKYALVLDRDVIPGSSYLQLLLRTSHTTEYSHHILGTDGYILPVPDTGHYHSTIAGQSSAGTDDVSEVGVSSSHGHALRYPNPSTGVFADNVMTVDFLSGMWFLETEIVKYFLLEVSDVLSSSVLQAVITSMKHEPYAICYAMLYFFRRQSSQVK